MEEKQKYELAKKIADKLFTNSTGNTAYALVMQMQDGDAGEKWSPDGVKFTILDILNEKDLHC